jgi:radical SAM superfamily enzyme YgiQ (UPF0313 family)
MRDAGAILLVACYELGHQPLAVAWPAAFLEQHGYRPDAMDVSIEPFDPAKAARARLVAISVPMHTALRLGVGIARRIRAVNPGCHVCFYGLYATLNADWLLATCADSVLAGELEGGLVELAGRLERGEPAGASRAPRLGKLAFPLPRRAMLPPLEKYARLEREGRRDVTGYVEASRGCKHLCRHCPIPPVYGGRFFVVPRDVVLADVRQLVSAGARHVTFGDPDFLNGPGHAMAVARALHAEFPDVTFDVTAKVEHLLRHRRLLPELAGLGCAFVVSAVESLSDTVLTHLAKGHTRADFVRALALAREAGLVLRPTWVAFTPWTTLDDYREMLGFVAGEDLVDHIDPVQYSVRLLVPPGSLLLDSAAMRPHLGALVQDGFHHRWTHPDPRMDRLHAEVGAAVAAAAERNEDPRLTFARVTALADAAAGHVSATPAPPIGGPDRRRPPRLTEPWFC